MGDGGGGLDHRSDDFREFTFTNVVELYRAMNPGFFAGTAIETEAEARVRQRQDGKTVTYTTIAFQRRDRTVCITLDRPGRLNAINDEMIAELDERLRSSTRPPTTCGPSSSPGAGRAFCTGADVNKASTKHDGEWAARTSTPKAIRCWHRLRQWDAPQEATPPYLSMTKPIICAVNGMTAGAGLDLVTRATSQSPPRTRRSSIPT